LVDVRGDVKRRTSARYIGTELVVVALRPLMKRGDVVMVDTSVSAELMPEAIEEPFWYTAIVLA
jgi:hypothetical protein